MSGGLVTTGPKQNAVVCKMIDNAIVLLHPFIKNSTSMLKIDSPPRLVNTTKIRSPQATVGD